MFIPAYLQQSRHGVWYLRWPVPGALHPARMRSSVAEGARAFSVCLSDTKSLMLLFDYSAKISCGH